MALNTRLADLPCAVSALVFSFGGETGANASVFFVPAPFVLDAFYETVDAGVELIVGAKIDHQFGPVVLLGMGGIGVEIYKDSAIRMAPLAQRDVLSMVGALKARKLLEGYRGSRPIHMGELTRTLMVFSDLLMGLEDRIESIDLNPVICTPEKCVVADARIMLNT